jgi:hypothetical protein
MRHLKHDSNQGLLWADGGYAIYSVVIVTLLIMLMFSGLISHGYNMETENVQHSLYKMRAYWAMVGAFEYSIARCRQKSDSEFYNEASCNTVSNFQSLCPSYNSELASKWQYDGVTTSAATGSGEFGDSGTSDTTVSSNTNLTYNPIVTLAAPTLTGSVVTLKYHTDNTTANSQTPALKFTPLSVGIAIDNATWSVMVVTWERK